MTWGNICVRNDWQLMTERAVNRHDDQLSRHGLYKNNLKIVQNPVTVQSCQTFNINEWGWGGGEGGIVSNSELNIMALILKILLTT